MTQMNCLAERNRLTDPKIKFTVAEGETWGEVMDWETGINIYALLGFPGGPSGKAATCIAGHLGLIPGSGRSLEEGMAIHSRVPAWRISWTEEHGGLQYMDHKESARTHTCTHTHTHTHYCI